jgi:hypothetical protein
MVNNITIVPTNQRQYRHRVLQKTVKWRISNDPETSKIRLARKYDSEAELSIWTSRKCGLCSRSHKYNWPSHNISVAVNKNVHCNF